MRILAPTQENLVLAAQSLRRGEVVGMPTETVYGLAGNALDPLALSRIFAAKERPTFDPLIVHVGPAARGLGALEHQGLIVARDLGELARSRAEALIQAFWPGPLTLVLPKSERVPDLATSGLPSVALRMPRHPIAQALIALAGTPLAAPSANRFGRISPTCASDVASELGDRIDWTLDGGPCEIGLESTVVSVAYDGTLALLRPGGTPRNEIERVAGVELQTRTSSSAPGAATSPQAAPGMLESHYAPKKPMRLLPASIGEASHEAIVSLIAGKTGPLGLLLLSGNADSGAEILARLSGRKVVARTLSRSGDLAEAARNLFAEMRSLDASEAEEILAEPCMADFGLGHAIADRLKRASTRSR